MSSKVNILPLLLMVLLQFLYTEGVAQTECEDDDDDTPIGTITYSGPVCTGNTATITIIITEDDDNDEGPYNITYTIGGQEFIATNIHNEYQAQHLVNSNTIVVLNQIFDIDENCIVNSNFTLLIDVSPSPELTVNNILNANCELANGAITLGASGGTPPYQFQIEGGPLQFNPTFDNLPAGNYLFTVVDANNCTDILMQEVLNEGAPSISVTEIISPTCGEANGAITLAANGGTPPYQYQINESSLQDQPIFEGLLPGPYDFLVTDSEGCVSYLNVDLFDNTEDFPAAEILSPNPISACTNEPITLEGTSFIDGTMNWYFNGDGVQLSTPFFNFTEVSFSNPGQYWIYYSFATEDCPHFSTDSILIEVSPGTITASTDTIYVTADSVIIVEALANSNISEIAQYPQNGILSEAGNGIYQYFYSENQDFTDSIIYVVCSPACTSICDTGQIVLIFNAEEEEDPCDLSNVPDNLLPEGLTLNNDGYNESLEIRVIDPNTCPFNNSVSEVIIFNRWGDKVFEQSPYENNWDGRTRSGEKLPPGTYYYVVRINLPDQEPFVRFKNITLFY